MTPDADLFMPFDLPRPINSSKGDKGLSKVTAAGAGSLWRWMDCSVESMQPAECRWWAMSGNKDGIFLTVDDAYDILLATHVMQPGMQQKACYLEALSKASKAVYLGPAAGPDPRAQAIKGMDVPET
ncbi:MAG: hypothetical protein FRX49_10517 [Trebouxia sp. A1-2]|nr:MAG: hypothetical protein FRX49_10517 [Trebouxia sp. A1-2]